MRIKIIDLFFSNKKLMEKRLKELNENALDYIKKCKETKNKSIREIQQFSTNYQEKFK